LWLLEVGWLLVRMEALNGKLQRLVGLKKGEINSIDLLVLFVYK
jgi:hypothetical protein